MNSTEIFWDRILSLSEGLSGMTAEEVRAAFLGIEEGFADAFDPADSYREYVTVMLCRAIGGTMKESNVASQSGDYAQSDCEHNGSS